LNKHKEKSDQNKWPVTCPKCRGIDAERAYCDICKGSGMAKKKANDNKFIKPTTVA
jgi:DnaJ-class molecular chaperone